MLFIYYTPIRIQYNIFHSSLLRNKYNIFIYENSMSSQTHYFLEYPLILHIFSVLYSIIIIFRPARHIEDAEYQTYIFAPPLHYFMPHWRNNNFLLGYFHTRRLIRLLSYIYTWTISFSSYITLLRIYTTILHVIFISPHIHTLIRQWVTRIVSSYAIHTVIVVTHITPLLLTYTTV
jgi:hypothetical protein